MMDLYDIAQSERQKILVAAAQEAPLEMCGFIVADRRLKFVKTANVSETPSETFEIALPAWLDAQWRGDIVGIVHSHPQGEPFLSGADRKMQVEFGLPWILATQGRLKWFRPAPHLRGRVFEYGKADCGTLIRDAFMLMGLDFPDHPRGGIDDDAAQEFWVQHLARCGFVRVSDDLQAGDVLLTCHDGNASHAALYLGNDQILHHTYNQLSRREPFSQWWSERVHSVWRHPFFEPEMMQAVENDLLHSVEP